MARKKKSAKFQFIVLIVAVSLIFFERIGLGQKIDDTVNSSEIDDKIKENAEKIANFGNDVTTVINDVTTDIGNSMNENNGIEDKNTAVANNDDVNNSNVEVVGDLEVHYIYVGQGDATLIKYNDYTMLIDSGEKGESDKLITYLESVGVEEISTFVGTHPHSDHIGAVPDVFDAFDVKEVIIPNAVHTTKTFENMITSIEDEGSDVIEAKAGYTYSTGALNYEILSPLRESYKDLNDYSVVILMNYGDMDFIFSGDATKLVEKDILDTGKNIEADILKLGHHGSRTSSSDEYIKAINADVAIISAGIDNDYNHPHKEVLDALNSNGVDILRNDLLGDIVLTTDGYEYNISNIVH